MCYVASTHRRLTDYAVRTLVLTYGPNGNAQPQSGWRIWAVAGVSYGGLAVLTNSVICKKKK